MMPKNRRENRRQINRTTTVGVNVCPNKCTYIGKNHLNFIRVWLEMMSLKSDRLEIGLSIPSCHLIKLEN